MPGSGSASSGSPAITAWAIEDIRAVQPGESFAVAGYELRLDGVEERRGPNYGGRDRTVLRCCATGA